MDKAAFAPFGRRLRRALEGLDTPPHKARVRVGQGVNVLAFVGERESLPFLLTPSPQGTQVGLSYPRELEGLEATWLERLEQEARALDEDPAWPLALAWAAEQPGISIVGKRPPPDVPMTSGGEEVIRLLEPCNAACDFCACIGVMPDYATTEADVRERVERALASGKTRVAFTGGEPTLLAKLPELVAQVKRQGVTWVNVQTNGIRLADEARVKALAEAGLDSVLVSIHSHKPAVHDAVMKVPGALKSAVTGIVHCLRAGIEVNLNCVVHRDNLRDLPAYLHFFHKRFVRHLDTDSGNFDITLSFVSPIGWTLEHLDLIPRISDAAPVLAVALQVAERLDLKVHVPGLCGLPACTMPGYESFFDELKEDSPPQIAARRYVPACDSCHHRPKCSGYWSVYLDRFGESELGTHVRRPWARQGKVEAAPIAPEVLDALRELAAVPMPDDTMADTLNERGLLRPTGAKWSPRTVFEARERHGIEVIVPEGMGDG